MQGTTGRLGYSDEVGMRKAVHSDGSAGERDRERGEREKTKQMRATARQLPHSATPVAPRHSSYSMTSLHTTCAYVGLPCRRSLACASCPLRSAPNWLSRYSGCGTSLDVNGAVLAVSSAEPILGDDVGEEAEEGRTRPRTSWPICSMRAWANKGGSEVEAFVERGLILSCETGKKRVNLQDTQGGKTREKEDAP